MAGRRRGDYMLRLIRAMIAAWRAEPALNAWYDSANNARILMPGSTGRSLSTRRAG